MVEGANNTSTESEWILLGDYLEREFVRLHSARLTDRLVRRSLDERRLQYRYLDADGNLHAGSDLPKAILGGRPRSAVKSMPSLGQPSLFRGIRGS